MEDQNTITESISVVEENKTKKCAKCSEILDVSNFYRDKVGKAKGSKDGLYCYCKKCVSIISHNNLEKGREKRKIWQQLNSEKMKKYYRKSSLKFHYGITVDEYNEMFLNQNGKCAICGIEQKDIKQSLSVDHCHNTDKIRGLLCENCNFVLGNFNDSIENIKNAIQYLENQDKNIKLVEEVKEKLSIIENNNEKENKNENKKCSRCGETDIKKFNKNKGNKDGLNGHCKECQSFFRRRSYMRKKEGYIPPDKYRYCRKCGTTNNEDFHESTKDKISCLCKKCVIKKGEEYRLLSPEKYKKDNREGTMRKHNITIKIYEHLLNMQNDKCLICEKNYNDTKQKYLAVDHCHKIKKVRGLLCVACNSAIGHSNEDTNILGKAIEYLRASQQETE